MWSQGTENGYSYWVKHYENGSEFGIDGGRISKLQIDRDGQTVASYERGWDIEPKGCSLVTAYKEILKRYN